MNNTERLICSYQHALQGGLQVLNFMVGRYTGNGPAVVAALRRRGYVVQRNLEAGSYRISGWSPADSSQ